LEHASQLKAIKCLLHQLLHTWDWIFGRSIEYERRNWDCWQGQRARAIRRGKIPAFFQVLTVANCGYIDIVPRGLSKVHGFELIDVIDV
jgi:hypothetical protein